MRPLLRSPAFTYYLVLAIPVASIAVTLLAGSQPRAQAQWFQIGSWICAAAFVVLFVVSMVLAWARPRKPIDERAEDRLTISFLIGFLFATDSLALGLAPASSAISVLVIAIAVAWLLLWSWTRVRLVQFTTSYVIQRSPDVVFPFIADKRNLPQWWSEYQSVEMLTPGPIGRGTCFRAHTRIPPGGRAFVADVELLEFEPNRRMTSRVSSGARPNQDEYTFEPIGAGTRVDYRFDFEHSFTSAALGARLLKFVADGVLKESHERAQNRIKEILEASAAL